MGLIFLGLTQALRNLGVLGFLAVTQIKLSANFCVSPDFIANVLFFQEKEAGCLFHRYLVIFLFFQEKQAGCLFHKYLVNVLFFQEKQAGCLFHKHLVNVLFF